MKRKAEKGEELPEPYVELSVGNGLKVGAPVSVMKRKAEKGERSPEPDPEWYVELSVGNGLKVGVPVLSPTFLMAMIMSVPMEDWLRTAAKDPHQKQARHLERWALMRQALDRGLSWDEAPIWCSQELRKTGRPASPATVMRSYNKIEAEQRTFGLGRPRRYKPRQR